MYDACLELKAVGKISHVWSYNGIIHYKIDVNRYKRGIRVFHIRDLEETFGLKINNSDLP